MPFVMPVALTIAGSDSGGGAGIQADLKTFTALDVYGASVVTAITAQNTLAVTEILALPIALVRAQLDAVMTDIGARAAKTGMLASAELVEAVAHGVRQYSITKLVVDPVMVAKSGDKLLQDDAISTIRHTLLPLALVVTPNLPEAEVLTGHAITNEQEMRRAAEAIAGLGARHVVIKGGHLDGPDLLDLLYDGVSFLELRSPRIATNNTHGTGCTFAAAITAYLAKGEPVDMAVTLAKNYVTGAVQHSLTLGAGHGPLDHMWMQRR